MDQAEVDDARIVRRFLAGVFTAGAVVGGLIVWVGTR